jgi:lipopolysaccharide/colanic/teichoic acid biosynthesis glycosyltransferase
MTGEGSLKLARDAPPSRPYPYLSGLSAHRVIDLIALQIAPAATASAIAWSHLNSEWRAGLIFLSMLVVSMLVRRVHYPFHLIPFASATLYLLTPPLGAALAMGISVFDGYAVSNLTLGELVAPVLGAWVVTGLGAVLNHRFRQEREVRIAVIGSHEFTRGLEAELAAVGVRGYLVIGCIDPEHPCEEEVVAGVRCLGSLPELRKTIVGNGIELLVLGPLTSGSKETAEGEFRAGGVSRLEVFERVADACLDLPVSMIEAGQLYEELFGHVPLGTTTSAWFQYLLHPRYKASWPMSKRLVDLGVGLIAGIIVTPILLVSAIAIKLSDRGPVLYRQTRIGEGGREIELLKLRTMDKDLGDDEEAGEDRATPVGRVLRRLHINELPQIWQVLRGEMSLVGPRPEIPAIVSSLEARFTYYDRRHLLKPGITGWAQVRCGYSGTPVGEAWKLCHDLYYLKRRSLFFELLIMLETLSTVFFPEPINRPDERFIVGARAGDELPSGLEEKSLEAT